MLVPGELPSLHLQLNAQKLARGHAVKLTTDQIHSNFFL